MMTWIPGFRVQPPQKAVDNRVPAALQVEEAGERVPTQATTATIPSVASQLPRR